MRLNMHLSVDRCRVLCGYCVSNRGHLPALPQVRIPWKLLWMKSPVTVSQGVFKDQFEILIRIQMGTRCCCSLVNFHHPDWQTPLINPDTFPRAFQSGFEADTVMCQAVNTTMANYCGWASCGEWCLTKTSGFCPQIHATVRRNATDVLFENCTRSSVTHCPQVSVPG